MHEGSGRENKGSGEPGVSAGESARREARVGAQGWTRAQGPVGNDCRLDRIEHEEMKDQRNQCTRVPQGTGAVGELDTPA